MQGTRTVSVAGPPPLPSTFKQLSIRFLWHLRLLVLEDFTYKLPLDRFSRHESARVKQRYFGRSSPCILDLGSSSFPPFNSGKERPLAAYERALSLHPPLKPLK